MSPSWCGPQHYPRVFDLGLERMRALGLEPVEYAFTRVQGTPSERAEDLHRAFADPTTAAVFASIGGEDQIKVIRHLDDELLRANPKPFFGYSDNTNLLVHLDGLGVPSFHGGAVMVQWGRPGAMHPVTEASLRAALAGGTWQVPAASDLTDVHGDWATDDLTVAPVTWPAAPWTWHGPSRRVSGRLWGGCLEILDWVLGAGRVLPSYAGRVLLLETSEELPSADEVRRMLVVMGERGLLEQFVGAVVARPKAWSAKHPVDREAYTAAQREAVVDVLAEYAPEAVVVMGLDAGHADPMVVLPIGREVVLDPVAGTVVVDYGPGVGA